MEGTTNRSFESDTNPGSLKDFEVFDPHVINSSIRELLRHPGSIYLAAHDKPPLRVTTRLARFEQDMIEFELHADEERIEALLSATAPYVIADLGFVRIQFDLQSLRISTVAEHVSLLTGLPETLFRIQRRQGVRVRPFPAAQMHCNIRDKNGKLDPWSVVDLSVVGLALKVPTSVIVPAVNTVIEHAHLEGGTDTPIPVHLLVRRYWVPRHPAQSGQVLGCEFRYLDRNNERRLQMLITDIERRSFRLNDRQE